jgi:hypothetical protein
MFRCILVPLTVAGTLTAPTRVSNAASCQTASFAAELSAGDKVEKLIGNDLFFRLDPIRLGAKGELNGWEISMATAKAPDHDYIYPVNPPLRFNGLQILGASYGEGVQASLGHPHEMWFLLNRADYDRLSPLLTNALWPYSAPRPDQSNAEYLDAVRTVAKGWLKFGVVSYDLSAADSVARLKFRVEFRAPGISSLSGGLRPRRESAVRNGISDGVKSIS